MLELLNLILKNRNNIVSKNGLFTNDTFTMLQAIFDGKISNEFKLTPEQKKLLIDAFLLIKKGFYENTPDFIKEDPKCILHAIKIDVNSVNYVDPYLIDEDELEKKIINELKHHNYILNSNSPYFLISNNDVAEKSIELDVKSADDIAWYSFNSYDNLINKVIENNYILHKDSHNFLATNEKVVLASIKKDINSIEWADSNLLTHNKEIFKYLLEIKYEFPTEILESINLSCLNDPEIMHLFLKNNNCYNGIDSKEYIEKLNKLFNDMLNTKPTLKDFKPFFEAVLEESWKKYRNHNLDVYENIFSTICCQLQSDDSLEHALISLTFIDEIKKVLQHKYPILYKAMEEYFEIYHSDNPNKLEKMQPFQDTIANLSALYVSKSKDNYKNNQLKIYYDRFLKPYFKLKEDHPIVKKSIIEMMQREEYYRLFVSKNKEVSNFLNQIKIKYENELPQNVIKNMINAFVTIRGFKVEVTKFIDKPKKYEEYLKYLKAKQLIIRLNNNFIKIDGIEVSNYRNLIKYDNKTKKYIYAKGEFTEKEIKEFNKFMHYEQVFNNIKKDIIKHIKKLQLTNDIDQSLYHKLAKNLSLSDEYFTFNLDKCLKCIKFKDFKNILLYPYNQQSFLNNESYNLIYDLVINKGLFWLLLILINCTDNYLSTFKDSDIDPKNILSLINQFTEILDISKNFGIDIKDFKTLMLVKLINNCASDFELSILSKETIEKLCKYKDYTENKESLIIKMATELVCAMTKRYESTVPYISGETTNYKYSMYDSYDESLLLAGINTDACFRIDGNDHDFLHYCALDKNGFVIKITDHYGNFVARAAGFRNGNCVFVNQLRTIHDEGGNGYLGNYESELLEIVDTFIEACSEIVNTSESNSCEEDKIEHVFATKSYSLNEVDIVDDNRDDVTVPQNILDKIGKKPMDNISKDWDNFLDTTPNISYDTIKDGYFETDYGSFPLLCIASIKDIKDIKPEDLVFEDVKAHYIRKRNKVKVIKNTEETNHIVNKIKAINLLHEDKQNEFKKITLPKDSIVITGDGFYIVLHNYEIIDSCYLKGDERTKIEYEYYIEYLKELIKNRHSNINKIINETCEQINKKLTKKLNY